MSKHEDDHDHSNCGHDHSHEPMLPVVNMNPKIGRNDPCPCESGKKYKKCCLGKQG